MAQDLIQELVIFSKFLSSNWLIFVVFLIYNFIINKMIDYIIKHNPHPVLGWGFFRKTKGVSFEGMFNRKYDFIAIDCEKASNEPASLCSIGIACFKNGRVKATKEYIVRPYPFVFYAGSIVDGAYHGVPVEVYENAPTINQIWPKLKKFLDKNIIVGHGINGDLQLIQIALEHFGVIFNPPGQERCICTNIASIYTYPEFESHKLKSLCEHLNIPIDPHHALSDAKAAGYLLLDMLNVTDCKTAYEFIDICLEYNQIITTKYTDRNIEKYEQKIKELFNYDEEAISYTYKVKKIAVDEIIEYFKNKKPNFDFPKLNIVYCISPIIEVYKNKQYSDHIDELSKLNPFSHDGFLYLQIDKNEYTLFFGILMDKMDMIYNLFMFLAKISIPKIGKSFSSEAYKDVLRYRQTVYLMSSFMFEIEHVDEDDIFKYIEYIYLKQANYFRSYDFERQYDIILNKLNAEKSMEVYKANIIEVSKLIGLYLGIIDNFSGIADDIFIPNTFNNGFNLLDSLIEMFLIDKSLKQGYDDFEFTINKWYNKK